MPDNKFEPLRDYLLKEKRVDFVLTFEEIEEILVLSCREARSAPNGGTTTRCGIRGLQRQAIHEGGYNSRRTPDGIWCASGGFDVPSDDRRTRPISPSWCFPARRRCRCSPRRRWDISPGAASRSSSSPHRTPRNSARASPPAAIRSSRRCRSVRGAGRGGERGRRDRGGRRQRLQSSVRAAGDRALADLRGGRSWPSRQHRLVVRALRHPQAARPRAWRLRRPEAGAPFRRFEAMRDDKTMAAAILNPPFAIHARRAGLKDMGAVVDAGGPYSVPCPTCCARWARPMRIR